MTNYLQTLLAWLDAARTANPDPASIGQRETVCYDEEFDYSMPLYVHMHSWIQAQRQVSNWAYAPATPTTWVMGTVNHEDFSLVELEGNSWLEANTVVHVQETGHQDIVHGIALCVWWDRAVGLPSGAAMVVDVLDHVDDNNSNAFFGMQVNMDDELQQYMWRPSMSASGYATPLSLDSLCRLRAQAPASATGLRIDWLAEIEVVTP